MSGEHRAVQFSLHMKLAPPGVIFRRRSHCVSEVGCTVVWGFGLAGLQSGVKGRLADLDACGGLADAQPIGDRNPTPRASRVLTTSIRCGSERPSRSSRHTTSTSPSRRNPSAAVRPGRSSLAPETVSSKIRSHSALRSASVYKAVFCSAVGTRA